MVLDVGKLGTRTRRIAVVSNAVVGSAVVGSVLHPHLAACRTLSVPHSQRAAPSACRLVGLSACRLVGNAYAFLPSILLCIVHSYLC